MRPGSDPRWRPVPPAAARAPGLAPAALQRELWRRSDALPAPSTGDVFTPVPPSCHLPPPPAGTSGRTHLHAFPAFTPSGKPPGGSSAAGSCPTPRSSAPSLPSAGFAAAPVGSRALLPRSSFGPRPDVRAECHGGPACHCPALCALNPPRPKAPSPAPAQVKSHGSAPSLAWLAFQPTWRPNLTFPPAQPTLPRVPVSAQTATDPPAV